MVTYAKYKGYLAEHGISYNEEAKRLGITASSFSKKINKKNGMDFSLAEVRSTCNEYGLDANVFFLE